MTTRFCSGCGVKTDKKQKICPICGCEESVEYDTKCIEKNLAANSLGGLFSNIRLPRVKLDGPMFTDEQALLNGCYPDELYKEILKQKILTKNYKK